MPKNGIVMSIMQEKGGQGKSNSILNVAFYFSSKGYHTLIIDLDGQAADITYYLFGNHVGPSSDPTRRDISTIVDLLSGKASIADTVIPVDEGLDCIPANVDVTSLSSIHKISSFRKIINELKEAYDFILIDVPPTPNWSHVLCLSVCDYVIPIVNPDPASPKAFLSLNESIEEMQDSTNMKLQYLGVLVNKFDGRTKLSKSILQQIVRISEELGTSLFQTSIHQSIAITEQTLFHKGIFQYAPSSKAAKEYAAFGEEILERLRQKGVL